MLNHTPRDILAAGPDAVAAAFGVPNSTPHPLADQLSTAPLSRLAFYAGLAIRPQQAHESDKTVMARGMTSSDYAAMLASASTTLANRRFSAVAEHRAFTAVIECRDFRPEQIATTDVDGELAEVSELQPLAAGRVIVGGGATAQLKTYARILRASRQLIIDDNAGMLADAAQTLGTAAARSEGGEVYAVLETNPTMGDGELVFDAAHNNILAAPLDATSLAQGMAALRTMTLPAGNQADLTAAHLVVAADLELAARKLIHESGLQITVTASGRLPTGRWYLLPSPEVAPTIGVLKLKGASNPILVESWQDELAYDGSVLRARCDTGAVLVARTLIRGGA